MVICKTLKLELCDQINDRRQFAQDFIDKAFEFVSKLAKSKDINVAKIEASEENKIDATLAIVDSIEYLRRKVDFVAVRQNLKCCTNIGDLLGQQWFDNMIAKKDTSHLLILLLDTKKSEGVAMLVYIDRTVEILRKDDPSKLGRIRRGFKNPSEFFPTVGELIVYAHFKSSYFGTEMQYNVAERLVDCKVDIEGTKILVEIISFELPAELKYGMIMADVPNRSRVRVIQDKLKKQIPAVVAAANNVPIFLALNTTRGMDIDDLDIKNLVYGTLQFTPRWDNSGKIVGFDISRAPDSIDQVANGKLVSGIIHCQVDFDVTDRQMKLQGDIYKNFAANTPVNDALVEKMKKGIFNKPLPDNSSY
jgi:hypothetical protein